MKTSSIFVALLLLLGMHQRAQAQSSQLRIQFDTVYVNNEPAARVMIGELRTAAVFDGVRGAPATDKEALAQALVNISQFAWAHRDRLAELDVNPLICAGSRIVAVDALIVKKA